MVILVAPTRRGGRRVSDRVRRLDLADPFSWCWWTERQGGACIGAACWPCAFFDVDQFSGLKFIRFYKNNAGVESAGRNWKCDALECVRVGRRGPILHGNEALALASPLVASSYDQPILGDERRTRIPASHDGWRWPRDMRSAPILK